MFSDDDLIHRYTRAHALADGVLSDVTTTAAAVGFRHPTAVTTRVWAECVAVPPALAAGHGQDVAGRLHDVLFSALVAARRTNPLRDRATFEVKVLVAPGRHEVKALWLHCGPGDAGEPVLTVMLEGED